MCCHAQALIFVPSGIVSHSARRYLRQKDRSVLCFFHKPAANATASMLPRVDSGKPAGRGKVSLRRESESSPAPPSRRPGVDWAEARHPRFEHPRRASPDLRRAKRCPIPKGCGRVFSSSKNLPDPRSAAPARSDERFVHLWSSGHSCNSIGCAQASGPDRATPAARSWRGGAQAPWHWRALGHL